VEFATSREEIEAEYKQRVKEFKRSRSSVSIVHQITAMLPQFCGADGVDAIAAMGF
jgi:hypothetical protein